jgi:hypothetical protein
MVQLPSLNLHFPQPREKVNAILTWRCEFSGSVLISERGIYAASPFKAIGTLKRAKSPRSVGKIGHFQFSKALAKFG